MLYCIGVRTENKWCITRVLDVSFVRGKVDHDGDSGVGTTLAPLPLVEVFTMSVRRQNASQSALSEWYSAG